MTNNDYSKLIENLKKLILIEKSDIYVLFIYSAFIGLFGLIVPVSVSSLVTTLAFGTLLQPIIVLSLLIILFLGINAVFSIIQSYISEYLERRLFTRTLFKLSQLVLAKKLDYPSHPTEHTNRIFDLVTVQKSFSSLASSGVFAIVGGLIGMVIVVFYHPIFLVYNALILFFVIYIVIFRFHKKGIETAYEISNKKYSTIAWLQEIVRHKGTFQIKGGEEFASKKMLTEVEGYLGSRKNHFKVFVRQSMGFYTIQVLAGAFLLGLGGYLVTKNQLTIGQFVAAELILAKVLNALLSLPKYLESWYDFAISWQKISNLLSLEEKTITQKIDEHELKKILTFNGSKVLMFSKEELPTDSAFLIQYYRRYERNTQVLLLKENEIFSGTLFENIFLDQDPFSKRTETLIESLGLENWLTFTELDKKVFTYGEGLTEDQIGKILLLRALATSPDILILSRFFQRFNLFAEPRLIQRFLKAFQGNLIITENKKDISSIKQLQQKQTSKKR